MEDARLGCADLFGVNGKTVLVTGGARGIGLMLSAAYVANGATVFVSSRDATACEAAASELSRRGPGRCVALPEDLGEMPACERLAARLAERTEALDVLVNNSGVTWGQPLEEYAEKGWDKVWNVNVKGIFYLTRALLPLLEKAGARGAADPARVINVGSVAGIVPQLFPTYAYDASKIAVHHLTRKLAMEFADRAKAGRGLVTVNAIAPGIVPTKMSKQLTTYTDEATIAGNVPLGRVGMPEDMAGAALFLSSRAGAWLTGVVLPVDGGQVAKL